MEGVFLYQRNIRSGTWEVAEYKVRRDYTDGKPLSSSPWLCGALKVILRNEQARIYSISSTPITPCCSSLIIRIDAKQCHGHLAITLAPTRMNWAILITAFTLHCRASSVCL